MKKSTFMPIINQDFELYYWSKTYQSHGYGMNPLESTNQYSEIEPLYRLHSHDGIEFLVFLDGECEFYCEGRTYFLTQGDVVVIPPYAVHKANVKDFHNYERIVTNISEKLLADFLSITPSMKENIFYHKSKGSYVVHLNNKNLEELVSLLREVTDRQREGEENQSFALHYFLFQALQIILNPAKRAHVTSKKSEQDQRLVSIIEYIESHLTDPSLNLENISKHFHLNKYYFSHYFKNNMNIPFYRYVLLKRLATAVTLIKQNEHSIEEIAATCGFQDYSSFYRLFKKEYNLSPKNLQKAFKR